MLSTRFILRNAFKKASKYDQFTQIKTNFLLFSQFLSTTSKLSNASKDEVAAAFFNPDVQSLLKSLTRVDLNVVYTKKKLNEKALEKPVYKFLTDEELQKELLAAKKKADEMLQMPPVLSPRQPINKVLSRDPALKGLETSTFIFTDITFGVADNQRLIIVRETDGTLREADWETRDRVTQIYFPKPGRSLKPPRLFQEEYLKDLFKRKEYVFILDKACAQYEPDDPEYKRITDKTFDNINENNDFNLLRSTRHFGPMVFYFVWNRNIDKLLVELIETCNVEEGKQLLRLYVLLHNVDLSLENVAAVNAIKEYITKFSVKKGPLELALQAFKEVDEQRRALQRQIEVAHGKQ